MVYKNQQVSFYQNSENIKNHMVQYLAKTGSVSKTLFGIELGSVCKIPNRGRTKLILETYPELFHADGEMVSLRTSMPASLSTQPAVQCQTSPVQNIVESKPAEPMSNFQYIPQVYQVSMSNESLGRSSIENIWDPSHWYPHPPATYPSPSSPPSYYHMQSPNPSCEASMDLGRMQSMQHQVVYQQQNVDLNTAVQQEVRCGELCMYQPPSEEMALNILNDNNGAMEVSKLMEAMGVMPQDQIGQASLYNFLSHCPSIIIQGDIAYVHQVPSQGESDQDAAGEPGEYATPEEPQYSHSGDIPDQSKVEEDASDDVLKDKVDESGTGSEGNHKQDDLPEALTKAVKVGQIHIGNINISTVNLHLHVDDIKGSQVSQLMQLQKMMQEMFSGQTMAK
eukprot:TRINITY_DN1031_c0_g1_i1.p1 TRINITY_DN1031_c0_g1~~TRINITY_DN1031_c0_g1_i1.p1  ORF type:complete len:394 (+),score=32.43 TRINITY_DN1031_c0_g1_i1:1459-2640(+)